jgi:hypothetical protein
MVVPQFVRRQQLLQSSRFLVLFIKTALVGSGIASNRWINLQKAPRRTGWQVQHVWAVFAILRGILHNMPALEARIDDPTPQLQLRERFLCLHCLVLRPQCLSGQLCARNAVDDRNYLLRNSQCHQICNIQHVRFCSRFYFFYSLSRTLISSVTTPVYFNFRLSSIERGGM